jgi:serine/threonine protein kinase
VAVKIVKKKDLNMKDQELLKREIEVLKICQHPNIIKLEDVFENQDYIYIVMEYLSGGDFFNFLEKRKFKISEQNAKRIMHELATSIYYLHSFGIAHRDLKPENILMVSDSDNSQIKLVDFGLSKSFGPGEFCKEPFGTLCYVAPEILLQRSYDKSVDLWSLGVIMHLMLCGTLPFDSEDDREIARKTIYDDLNMTHSMWNGVSDEAKELVQSNSSFI